MGCKAVVKVATYAKVQCPVTLADCVLRVKGKLLYVGMSFEPEGRSSGGQVKRRKDGTRIRRGVAVRAAKRRHKVRVDDAHRVIFIKEGLLISGSNLHIVDAFCVVDIRTQARIGEASILRNCQRLNGTEISKSVFARVVVELIAPHECPQREHGVRAEYVSPGWGDVEGLNLRALICWSNQIPRGIGGPDVQIIK